MTPTHILQREEMERRLMLGLPPIESINTECMISANTSTINREVLNKKYIRNKWKNIKKGKTL